MGRQRNTTFQRDIRQAQHRSETDSERHRISKRELLRNISTWASWATSTNHLPISRTAATRMDPRRSRMRTCRSTLAWTEPSWTNSANTPGVGANQNAGSITAGGNNGLYNGAYTTYDGHKTPKK